MTVPTEPRFERSGEGHVGVDFGDIRRGEDWVIRLDGTDVSKLCKEACIDDPSNLWINGWVELIDVRAVWRAGLPPPVSRYTGYVSMECKLPRADDESRQQSGLAPGPLRGE